MTRASERAAALEEKSQRLQDRAQSHFSTADGISEHIPFGQPILIGHHSEGRARRDAERIHSHTRKGLEASRAAQDAQRRAAAAAVNAQPEHPSTTANRINRLTAWACPQVVDG